MRGQLVCRLVDDVFESGQHSVIWNGRDDNGRDMSSGVYFVRMIAGDEVSTRRMVLLK
jgi:flagellar hook assembly protein FlgD